MPEFGPLEEVEVNQWSIVFKSRNYERLMLWSLVLQSAGIDHQISSDNSGWFLLTSEENLNKARVQIKNYEQENRNWPPVSHELDAPTFLYNRPPTILIMGVLSVFFLITGSWNESISWFKEGAVDNVQILEKGQWWRLITGLTLHSDVRHLFGNILIGGFISHFLGKILGGGLAWFLILLSGFLGNFVNIIFREEYHLSVGFSTAVFGAIGILAGMEMIRRRNLKAILLPFGAALGLIALLGTGGGRTDIGAHWSGLAVGGCLGGGVAFSRNILRRMLSWPWQVLFFVLTSFIVWGSWALALSYT